MIQKKTNMKLRTPVYYSRKWYLLHQNNTESTLLEKSATAVSPLFTQSQESNLNHVSPSWQGNNHATTVMGTVPASFTLGGR